MSAALVHLARGPHDAPGAWVSEDLRKVLCMWCQRWAQARLKALGSLRVLGIILRDVGEEGVSAECATPEEKWARFGRAEGYPECCIAYFCNVWSKAPHQREDERFALARQGSGVNARILCDACLDAAQLGGKPA